MSISVINNYKINFNSVKPGISFRSKTPDDMISTINDSLIKNMSEKEKMINGYIHCPIDEELRNDRNYASDMCYKYNNMHSSKKAERRDIIRKLVGKTGEMFKIEQGFKCDYGYNIEFGERFFANYNLVVLDSAKVKFGNDVMIGPNCGFYTVNHPIDPKLRATGIQVANPITVGNNVWIGGGVTVLGGVNIGDNVVIGAGSVVTKDIPANTVCYGVPCKVIKKLS